MLAERVFAPAPDLEARMREHGIHLSSLESGIPLQGFDIIGFSLLYEMNYTNVLGMLSLGGIPFLASRRSEKDPLIIAGGPCTSNPEPVADFFDAMLSVTRRLFHCNPGMDKWKEHGGASKAAPFAKWSHRGSIYPGITNRYTTAKDCKHQTNSEHGRVCSRNSCRAVIPELRADAFPNKPIVPRKPIHDRLRLEVARAALGVLPSRNDLQACEERSVAQLIELTEQFLRQPI
jgi:hypothetical protein